MNIAISCSGEGRGHAMRMVAICEELIKTHTITFYVPPSVRFIFREQFPESDIIELPLLKLIKKNHSIRFFPTLWHSVKTLIKFFTLTAPLAKDLKKRNIQFIISDYEPFLPMAAKKAGVYTLAINHQGILNRYFSRKLSYFAARVTNWALIPHFDEQIVCSFYNGDVGPILRRDVEKKTVASSGKILVYLKPSFSDSILPLLEAYHDNFEFILFPQGGKDFLTELAACSGIIAPAGHQLCCEALYYEKPILAVPEGFQYEQLLNARMIEACGLGLNCETPKLLDQKLGEFLSSLETFSIKYAHLVDNTNNLDSILNHLSSVSNNLRYSP